MATLKLDPEKSALIWHFVESYLSLNTREVRIFKEAVELLPGEERQAFMRYTNSYIEEGIAKGRVEGRVEGRLENLDSFAKASNWCWKLASAKGPIR